MVLTAEHQAELRAKKALETGDASFKPRGKANKAIFEKMKAEFDAMKKHAEGQADRVIKELREEISPVTALFSGSTSTDPQERINSRRLQNAANIKANKADQELVRARKAKAKAEAKANKAKANNTKAKAKASPVEEESSAEDEYLGESLSKESTSEEASASTAAPSEQNQVESESSDEEEPMPLAKPTPTPVESIPAKVTPTQTIPDVVYIPCKRQNADTKQQFEKIKVEFKPCTDAEKKKIVSPETLFEKVVDILKSCSSHEGDIMRFNRAVNNLPCNTAYKYCVDEKLQGNDTFSVVLLDIYTFEAVCKLSLV